MMQQEATISRRVTHGHGGAAPGHAARSGQRHTGREPIELVALDLDGTLLTTEKRITRLAINTVSEVRRRGVRVVLASARPPRSMRDAYNYLGLDTLQISYNGALIQDPVLGRNIHHQPL